MKFLKNLSIIDRIIYGAGVLFIIAVAFIIKDSVTDAQKQMQNIAAYKEYTLESKRTEVTDSAVQETIDETIKKAGGFYAEADTPVKEGSLVEFTYTHDGHDEEAESAHEESFVIGSQTYPAEFETALIGKKKGESADIFLSEEYGGEILHATVTAVKEPSTDITDEFVSSLGIEGVSSKEELDKSIREYLDKSYNKQYKDDIKAELETKIGESIKTDKEPSEELVSIFKADAEKTLNEAIEYASENGKELTLADVLAPEMEKAGFTGTEDEYLEVYAKMLAKKCLVYEDIARSENVSVSEEDYYSALASLWVVHKETYPTLKDFAETVNKEEYKKVLLKDKVLDHLADYYMEKQ